MKQPTKIRTTDAQIDAALQRARRKKRTATRILAARYDQTQDVIVVKLSTEATLTVPRAAIPGFDTVDPAHLKDLTVQASGFSVWSEKADTGVRIEQLLQVAAGPILTSVAAGILGKKRSRAKAASARENGRKGGRPAKKRSAVARSS